MTIGRCTNQLCQRCPKCSGRISPACWWRWAGLKRWRCDAASWKTCRGTASPEWLFGPVGRHRRRIHKATVSLPLSTAANESMTNLQGTARRGRSELQQWGRPLARTGSECRKGQCGCRCAAVQAPLGLWTWKGKCRRESFPMWKFHTALIPQEEAFVHFTVHFNSVLVMNQE